MSKIIACIDGSPYADNICNLSAWAANRTGYPVALLHVVAPHSDTATKGDISGQIGIGAKNHLLEELAAIDEAHSKLELKKGHIMIIHAKEELAAKGIMQAEALHLRGSLVETLADLEPQAKLIVMGKRGEQANHAPDHIGSNLERVARVIHIPILIVPQQSNPIVRFMIAYDGSANSQKAIEVISSSPLLKGLECHLLKVAEPTSEAQTSLHEAKLKLERSGFVVQASLTYGKHADDAVAEYADANTIDLLVIGAYGHSKIRSLILGSTTTSLVRKSKIPVMLIR